MAYINQQWRKFCAVGCSHGAHADPKALASVLAFCDDFKPDTRLHLGDYTDQAAFRAGAHGTTDETASISDDLTAGLTFLEQFAPTHLINGNHEDRLWRLAEHYNQIIARAASSVITEICDLARKLNAVHVDYYDINRPVVTLGNFSFLHGFMYNEQGVRDHAEHFGNCVIAHLHRRGESPGRRADHPIGYCVGTLARIEDLPYAKARRATAAWSHGLAHGEYSDTECHVSLLAL